MPRGGYYRKRFEHYRDSLFTFIDHDGVAWNNNNAEHAVKAFVMLRRGIGATSTNKGIREYLVLLSLLETCKRKGIVFLDFLRSGETDIDAFAEHQRKRRPAGPKPPAKIESQDDGPPTTEGGTPTS